MISMLDLCATLSVTLQFSQVVGVYGSWFPDEHCLLRSWQHRIRPSNRLCSPIQGYTSAPGINRSRITLTDSVLKYTEQKFSFSN